ncbi:hypothetical protein KVH22_25290 [Streptomyces olivaceus]|uniref:hypothetical protein n=1 Tax=Streptomyces TaxID=1883 RepID=UPI001CCDA385|nr:MULTISPECIES: hypothetical protein [Streptomyces]MBZ6258833.1 hypothetical protein [Streptomyces olivaceus]MCM8548925.1 hypothetical protein [Streptomyces sp. STCH 565 A]
MAETSENTQPPNTVRAEALSPELITKDNGYQVVRVALRTETGTIVYADLGHGQAQVYGSRLGRLGWEAHETSKRLTPDRPEQRSRRRGL